MGLLKIEGVTHWSIPVNDLSESEKFYGDLLGLKPLGRLGNSGMSCFNVGDNNILLSEREIPIDRLYYRAKGFFTGRELYFFDPSGNRLELRDPTWKAGMPEPSFDDL